MISIENIKAMMNSSKIASADILDILFDGRNKTYGAYELRSHYNQRMGVAIGSVLSICLLIFFATMRANKPAKGLSFDFPHDTHLADFKPDLPLVEPPLQTLHLQQRNQVPVQSVH